MPLTTQNIIAILCPVTNISTIQKGKQRLPNIMCHTTDSLNPRERLAQKIRDRTDDGEHILEYIYDVFYDRASDVAHGHRIQAARLLIIYGELGQSVLDHLRKMSPHSDRKADRVQIGSDAKLAKVIRRMSDDGEQIVAYLLDTMKGVDDSGKRRIRHNVRLAAARELLRRGYPCECTSAQTASDSNPTTERRAEPVQEPAAAEADNTEEILAKIDRIIEDIDPSEFDEDEDPDHKPDYSMWEIIRRQPRPKITEEHARIGAALFHEAVERQMRWKESDVQIPTRKDHHNYDDG